MISNSMCRFGFHWRYQKQNTISGTFRQLINLIFSRLRSTKTNAVIKYLLISVLERMLSVISIKLFRYCLLLLAVAALTFALLSCVDNDEPSGVGGGIFAPNTSSDVIATVGNSSIKLSKISSNPAFKQALADEIVTALVFDKAQREQIEITEEDIAKQVERVKKNFPDEESFNDTLERYGETEESFREGQRKYVAIEKLLRLQISYTEDDLRDFYDSNKNLVDQTYAAEQGLTEEERELLTYDDLTESVDEMYFKREAEKLFPKFLEETIREYWDDIKYLNVEPLTLMDFGVAEPVDIGAEEEAARIEQADDIPEEAGEETADEAASSVDTDVEANGEGEDPAVADDSTDGEEPAVDDEETPVADDDASPDSETDTEDTDEDSEEAPSDG